jgi:hypothetical protein
MTRLTNDMRNTIIDRVLEHRFGKAKAELEARKKALAVEAYDTLFPKELQAKLAEIPKDWLNYGSYFRLNVAGQSHDFETDKPLWNNNYKRFTIPREAPVCQKILTWAEDSVVWEQKRREAKEMAQAALARANTLPKLVAAWPEVEPFIYGLSATKANLPAVQTEKLNATLDLPVKETTNG